MSTKISTLTSGTTANASDKIPIERSGANRYITPAMLATYIGGGGGATLVALAKRTSTSQIVSGGATTIINFNYEIYDPGADLTIGASCNYALPADAIYRVDLEAFYVGVNGGGTWSSGDELMVDVYLNGSSLRSIASVRFGGSSSSNHYVQLAGTYTMDLAVADGPIDLRLVNTSASDVAIRVNSQMAIHKLT